MIITSKDSIKRLSLNRKFEFAASLLLTLPYFIWIILDKGISKSDTIGYRNIALDLYHLLRLEQFDQWQNLAYFGCCQRGPLIYWIGQFFLFLEPIFGDAGFCLQLVNWLAMFFTVLLFMKVIRKLFDSLGLTITGALLYMGSPIIVGLSLELWVEPLQNLILASCFYVLAFHDRWKLIGFSLWLIVLACLAALAKTSMAMTLLPVVPVAIYLIYIKWRADGIRWTRKLILPILFTLIREAADSSA